MIGGSDLPTVEAVEAMSEAEVRRLAHRLCGRVETLERRIAAIQEAFGERAEGGEQSGPPHARAREGRTP